jgi:ABC-type oligopeptide transport system ATPase subunit
MSAANSPLLEVDDLRTYFFTRDGVVRAVDGVSFTVYPGETLAIVGESGCGKTTLGRAVLGLLKPTAGNIFFNGTDISALHHEAWKALRKDMQLIFQDPYSSLNPRMRARDIVAEPIRNFEKAGEAEIRERVAV